MSLTWHTRRLSSCAASDRLSVLFKLDKWKTSGIRLEGLEQLQSVVRKLKMNPAPGRTIVVKGYAGPLASKSYNQALSLRRAKTVREYLLSHGVQAASIRVEAFGESVTVAEYCTASTIEGIVECHAVDRRVVIVARPGI